MLEKVLTSSGPGLTLILRGPCFIMVSQIFKIAGQRWTADATNRARSSLL
jgi:hypothetical protein